MSVGGDLAFWDVAGRLAQKGEEGQVIPIAMITTSATRFVDTTDAPWAWWWNGVDFYLPYDLINLGGFTPLWRLIVLISPGADETAYVRMRNSDDNETVTGTEESTAATEVFDSGWNEYVPSTTDTPVRYANQVGSDPGANSSRIEAPLLLIGLRID